MKLLMYTQIATVEPLKFVDAQVISSHTSLGMWLLIHIGIRIDNNTNTKKQRVQQNHVHIVSLFWAVKSTSKREIAWW